MNDSMLDGNAVAGVLADVFVPDMTVALTTCGNCGAGHLVGELRVHLQAPGAVLRCSSCGEVQIRLVTGPQRSWLDLDGVRMIQFDMQQ